MSNTTPTQDRATQLADAYEAVARVNHYMVGIVDKSITFQELCDAGAILIDRDNSADNADKTLNLALDLIEHAISAFPGAVA